MNLNDKTIAVIGLGYVGLPLAVEFGKQREVVGFDVNRTRVEELGRGIDSTLEVLPVEMAEARLLTVQPMQKRFETAVSCVDSPCIASVF